MEHAPGAARALGFSEITFGTLYVGGCSIEMHYQHAAENRAVYRYYLNRGDGWNSTPDCSIRDAVQSDDWDWIAIQHGTHGTARYTSYECYEKLSPLISFLRELAPVRTKYAFNLTWLGESTHQHHEILSYGGNMALMREKLVEVTKRMVADNPDIDLLVPTGTAIENARTSKIGCLTRDGYHLSYATGRFIAALAFVSTITGTDAGTITWKPEGVDEYALKVAVESVKNAQKHPFDITKSSV